MFAASGRDTGHLCFETLAALTFIHRFAAIFNEDRDNPLDVMVNRVFEMDESAQSLGFQ